MDDEEGISSSVVLTTSIGRYVNFRYPTNYSTPPPPPDVLGGPSAEVDGFLGSHMLKQGQ